MFAKSKLFILLIVTAFSTGNLQAQEPPPGCPEGLETLTNWWVTTPDIGHIVEVTATLAFSNTSGIDIEFDPDPADTMQIWSVPDVMVPAPIVFNGAPTGTVLAGDSYSYEMVIGMADLPLSQTGLAFRPVSISLGTMGPEQATFLRHEFICVEGRRHPEQSAIPAMSSWGRIALLLVLIGTASLVLGRRFA